MLRKIIRAVKAGDFHWMIIMAEITKVLKNEIIATALRTVQTFSKLNSQGSCYFLTHMHVCHVIRHRLVSADSVSEFMFYSAGACLPPVTQTG